MPVIGATDVADAEQYAAVVYWLARVLDDDNIPAQMTKRDPDVTGRCLTDEMMSRSEIACALGRLPALQEAALRLAFAPIPYDYACIGRAMGVDEREVHRLVNRGLAAMVAQIFGG